MKAHLNMESRNKVTFTTLMAITTGEISTNKVAKNKESSSIPTVTNSQDLSKKESDQAENWNTPPEITTKVISKMALSKVAAL